jgi:hypothetical protein
MEQVTSHNPNHFATIEGPRLRLGENGEMGSRRRAPR